jgi:uncharacterized protein (DUF1330 family)
MSVLVIVQGTPNPELAEQMKQYQQGAGPIVARHGGQLVARGSGLEGLAGHHKWMVGAVLRFPDLAAVHAWHNDPDYQKIIPIRTAAYSDLEITVFQE